MSAGIWRASLADPALACIHAADASELPLMVGAAEALGFRVTRIDFDGCRGKPDALARIAAALCLPDWFGGNWDALNDAINELGSEPSPGVLLVLAGLADWIEAAPAEVDVLMEILDEAAARSAEVRVPFWVVIEAATAG